MLEPLQVYDAGEHFMMSPLGEDEGGRGVYKVVTATEEGVKHSKPNKCVVCTLQGWMLLGSQHCM